MDRYREKTSLLFTELLYGLGLKQPPVMIVPISKSLGSPAPQTSFSTSPSLTSFGEVLTYFTLQFSNSQTNSSFLFSLTSHQIRGPPIIVHGSVPRMVWKPEMTIIGGCTFYDG